MKTYKHLYTALCSYDNLELAYKKARKGKTQKQCVKEFEQDLDANLRQLQQELLSFTYSPYPLTTFTVRDPKTRKISASHFRDRIVHHALCNILEPIFEKRFIHDSFANQKGKGTHKAILRYETFQRKVGPHGYAFKADIRHHFDTMDHAILLEIVGSRVKDAAVLWLLRKILANHNTETEGKGMPLGNLTSQFLANVYLGELDEFVKHTLKARFYLRYVDDFLILHKSRTQLEEWKAAIDAFLKDRLKLTLHPEKSRIAPVSAGTTLLGLRVFQYHRLLKKSNARRIWSRLEFLKKRLSIGRITKSQVLTSLAGWLAYAAHAATYKLRSAVISRANEIFAQVD